MSILNEIANKNPHKIVLSKSKGDFRKIVFARKIIKGANVYQLEKYTETQVFHENIPEDALEAKLSALFPDVFKQLNAFTTETDYDIKAGKKGNLAISKKAASAKNITIGGNNRKKKYILDEGMDIPAFYQLGIFTKDGKVAAKMQDKFRQINRFVEMVDDVLKTYGKEEISVIDFGCGKSYLTFFLYHYLTQVKGLRAEVLGLDLKEQVINNCNDLAAKCGYENLRFEMGNIEGYKTDMNVDMVVTLHACDTATDHALFNAISWGADYILSVPCCQHEVNGQIKSDNLSAITKYGIIKERTAALMTDAVRGCVLESVGYKTDLLEFIDIEHSPKNILIRAVKKNVAKEKRQRALGEAKALCAEFGFRQSLMELVHGDDVDTSDVNQVTTTEQASNAGNIPLSQIATEIREIISDNNDSGILSFMTTIQEKLLSRHPDFVLENYGYHRMAELIRSAVPGVSIIKDGNGIPHAELDSNREDVEEFLAKYLSMKEKKTDLIVNVMAALEGAFPHFDVRSYGYTYDVAFLLSFEKLVMDGSDKIKLRQTFKLSSKAAEE